MQEMVAGMSACIDSTAASNRAMRDHHISKSIRKTVRKGNLVRNTGDLKHMLEDDQKLVFETVQY